MTFDSPVYSRKTRIDLDIRVVNCTYMYTSVHIHTISRVIRTLEMHIRNARVYITHTFYILYVYII